MPAIFKETKSSVELPVSAIRISFDYLDEPISILSSCFQPYLAA